VLLLILERIRTNTELYLLA